MTDILTYINVELLGLKPFHLNFFKTGMMALCLALGLWILVTKSGARYVRGFLGSLNRMTREQHRILAWSLGTVFTAFLIWLRVRQYFELRTMWDMTTEANV